MAKSCIKSLVLVIDAVIINRIHVGDNADMFAPRFVFPVGHAEVVKLLVSRSADKSCKDKQGYTPLHAAAASGHIEIVKYLLRMGAEVSGLTWIFFKC